MRKVSNTQQRRLAQGAEIVKRLRFRGFCAYFVGGCVRDIVMGTSCKDIDIVTCAKTEQIKQVFPRKTYPVGAQFGTVLVVKDRIPFEVSTFRGEKERGRGRTKGKGEDERCLKLLEADVKRRDFTINGLAYDPAKGKIIDFVNGKEDIRKKVIRAIGKPRSMFIRDSLRIIRAVRFAVTLEFVIEDETRQAIKKMATSIKKVSKERIRDELISIFTSSNPALGLKLLDKCGLLKYILADVERLKKVQQPQAFHPEGDVFAHTLLMLEQLKEPSLVLAFACLFHDIAKPMTFRRAERIRFNGHDKKGAELTDRILRTFKFSNKDREDIVACVENHMRMMEAAKMRESTLKRLFARPTFETELQLHRIDCIGSHRDLTLWRFLKKEYSAFKKRPKIPKPLLNGYELIKMGFTPGPIFGKIHKQMVDMQLEAKLTKKSEARNWVRKKFGKEKKCL